MPVSFADLQLPQLASLPPLAPGATAQLPLPGALLHAAPSRGGRRAAPAKKKRKRGKKDDDEDFLPEDAARAEQDNALSGEDQSSDEEQVWLCRLCVLVCCAAFA
jgi:hypothetical protein